MTGLQKKKGITFIEVMVAAGVLAVLLLPVFGFLTNSVKDTERIYVEVISMSRAKQIMDTMLFQIPWRAIREGNPCRFEDSEEQEGTIAFLQNIIPELFGEGCRTSGSNVFCGEGQIKTDKGFILRIRAKVVDLDDSISQPLTLNIRTRSGDPKQFNFKELTSKDADGKYNLVKKIVVQVKYSLVKGVDPLTDKKAKSVFLVGFKSNLED